MGEESEEAAEKFYGWRSSVESYYIDVNGSMNIETKKIYDLDSKKYYSCKPKSVKIWKWMLMRYLGVSLSKSIFFRFMLKIFVHLVT